jgi:predicted dehydrogenase
LNMEIVEGGQGAAGSEHAAPTKVRIAVVGAGLIGARHVEETRRNLSSQLSAIVDVSPAAAALASRLVVPLYGSVTELLKRDKPDGVILATPNHLHAQQAMECIKARVPVLVEKPLAHSEEEAQRLCDASEDSGVPVLVGHHRRHSPILRTAVEVVHSRVMGPIVGAMGSAAFYKPDSEGYYDGPNAWRREAGGGPILINMIHEIDCLRALVGEIVAVQAIASNATRGFEVEDTAVINLRFHNGALGSFFLSDTGACPRSWEQTSRENAAFATHDDEDCYTIVGTHGSLAIPTMRLRYYDRETDRSWYRPFRTRRIPLERRDPIELQIEHFGQVIRQVAAPLVTARDGLQNVRVANAIAQSAATGEMIEVRNQ